MAKIFLFIIGAIFGSFLNVVVNRTIRGESIIYPPSHCEACGHRLTFFELIPLVSFISLKGRCKYCGSEISADNFFMELVSGLLTLIFFDPNAITKSIILLAAIYLALVIAMIDLKTFDIYLFQIGVLGVIGLVYRYLYLGFNKGFLYWLIGFTAVYYLIIKIAAGGLGDGDIYYYLALFPFIENRLLIWFTLFSIWYGAVVGVIKAYREKNRKLALPFCIFIFLAFITVQVIERFIL